MDSIYVIKLWDQAQQVKVYVPVHRTVTDSTPLTEFSSRTKAEARQKGERWLEQHRASALATLAAKRLEEVMQAEEPTKPVKPGKPASRMSHWEPQPPVMHDDPAEHPDEVVA